MGLGLSTVYSNEEEFIKKDEDLSFLDNDKKSSVITVIEPKDYIYVLLKDNNVECFSINKRDIKKAMEKYRHKIAVSSIISHETPYVDKIDEDTLHIYSTVRNQPLYHKGSLVSTLKITKVPFYLSKIIGM